MGLSAKSRKPLQALKLIDPGREEGTIQYLITYLSKFTLNISSNTLKGLRKIEGLASREGVFNIWTRNHIYNT